jgi:hypothetical protein
MANSKKKRNTKKSSSSNYKKTKKRVIMLILLLVLMIFLLGSGTYAWFSSNKHGTIESIDINVATVTGLEISEDAIDWKNELTKEDLINAYRTYPRSMNQLPDTLANVSTAGNVTNGFMDMFYGITSEENDGGFTLTTTDQEEKRCTGDEECVDKHYIAFDVFLKVTTPSLIGITANSSVLPQMGAQDKGSQNAARVGFVIEGTVGPTASGAAQALKGGSKALIWEPNYDTHSDTGVAAARNVYGITTSKTGASRIAYKGVNRAFQTPIYINQTDRSSYFTSVNPDIATTKIFQENQKLMNIGAGITKVRVYMWLEGQDVDMENNVAATKLSYTLEFIMMS